MKRKAAGMKQKKEDCPCPMGLAGLAAQLAPDVGRKDDAGNYDAAVARAFRLWLAARRACENGPGDRKGSRAPGREMIPFSEGMRALFPKKKGAERNRALLEAMRRFQEIRHLNDPENWWEPTTERVAQFARVLKLEGFDRGYMNELALIVMEIEEGKISSAQSARAKKRWAKKKVLDSKKRPKK